jgi:hypothetical protein
MSYAACITDFKRMSASDSRSTLSDPLELSASVERLSGDVRRPIMGFCETGFTKPDTVPCAPCRGDQLVTRSLPRFYPHGPATAHTQ